MVHETVFALKEAGFGEPVCISSTLQGSIYKTSNNSVVKITNRCLHKHSLGIVNNRIHNLKENILREATILKCLTMQRNAPKSIIKYRNFLACETNYYLVLEDGGHSLFDFVTRAHHLISIGHLDIVEWHKAVKVIFKQLVECIDFMHQCRICHFDISLENILINDVRIVTVDNKIFFDLDAIQVKLIDFGLADVFTNTFKTNKHCGKKSYSSPEIANKNVFDA